MSIFRPIIKPPEFKLKRSLRLFEVTMAGVGFIIGAGIYVLIGDVAGLSGSAIWISFILAGLAALLSGLSYAELSSMFPVDASEYVYANEGLGKKWGFFSYISIIMALITGTSTVALGFAGYFSALTGWNNIFLIAVLTIILFSFLNWFSVKKSALINMICTVASITGLLLIVFLAFFKNPSSVPTNMFVMPQGFFGLMKGASLIFFAYLGFEGIVKLSEETKNAKKTIPKAIILSIIFSTIIYVLVAIAAVKVLPWNILAESSAPLADVAAAVLGSKAFVLLGIIALLSTANTILMGILSSSRGFYGLGQIFPKFKFFTKVGIRETPTRAIIITTIIAILFLFFKDIALIAGFTNFMIFASFIIINTSLIKLRYSKPKLQRKFKIPLNINKFPILPVFAILISLFLLLNLEPINILLGIIVIILLNVTYFILYRKQKTT